VDRLGGRAGDWGKDFGALDKQGPPLYGGGPRSVTVRCYLDGRPSQPSGDLEAVVAGGGQAKVGQAKTAKAKPARANRTRAASASRDTERAARSACPAACPGYLPTAAGRVCWLSGPHATFLCSVGTAWFELPDVLPGRPLAEPDLRAQQRQHLGQSPGAVARGGRPDAVGRFVRWTASGSPGMGKRSRRRRLRVTKAEPVNNDIFVSVFRSGRCGGRSPQLARRTGGAGRTGRRGGEGSCRPVAKLSPGDRRRVAAADARRVSSAHRVFHRWRRRRPP